MKLEAIIEIQVPITLLTKLNTRAERTGVSVHQELLNILNELAKEEETT